MQHDMTTIPRRLAVSRGRAALLWMLGLFAIGQAVLGAWLYRTHPEMCDATWGFRYARLRERLAEAPGRPLVLFLGSSRAANGISPADFAAWEPRNGPRPVVFNFATLGAGPIRELLTLRRLLAHGIRPDWLVVEVWPAFWPDKGHYEEHMPILVGDAQLSDVRVLHRTYGEGWTALAKTVETCLVPLAHFRTEVLNARAPFLVGEGARREIVKSQVHWYTLDARGWLPLPWGRVDAVTFARTVELAHTLTRPLLEEFATTGNADWAIREMLRECREHGIRVALLYLPEHSALRSWYPPQKLSLLQNYLARLGSEHGLPIIDTRDWLDDDCFQDVLHLHPAGARTFSARFGPEVLRPLLEGEALPAHAALHLDGGRESFEGGSPAVHGSPALGP
jgi:hypothetical protein